MPSQEERAVVIPQQDGPGALEGIYVAPADGGEAGAVIAPPHPLYGGSMDSPVVNEIAWACRKRGAGSLRFNWRGVGASAGDPSGDVADADADYRAALEQLAETLPGALLACGYSFGAASALRVGAASERVRGLVLVAPPVALLDRAALADFDGPVLLLAAEHDGFAPAGELEVIAREARAGRLVVVPDADHFFGVGLAEISRATAEWLPPPAG